VTPLAIRQQYSIPWPSPCALRDVQVKAVIAVYVKSSTWSQLGLLCVSGTTCRPAPRQSTARGWSTMDRAARDSSNIGMATPRPRLWTASCVNRDVNCSADGPRAAPDCKTDCGSRPVCSCSSILTNQSADKRERRVRCIRALRPYLGSYYWQLFKSYISQPRCRIVSRIVTLSRDIALLSVSPHVDGTPWPMANFQAVSDVAETATIVQHNEE